MIFLKSCKQNSTFYKKILFQFFYFKILHLIQDVTWQFLYNCLLPISVWKFIFK